MIFESGAEVVEHLGQPPFCEPIQVSDNNNPEDGIHRDILGALSKRGENRVDSWEIIWRLIFPKDMDIPASGTLHLIFLLLIPP